MKYANAITTSFGQFVMNYLSKYHLTISDISKELGIDRHTVAKHVMGGNMHPSTMEVYANYFKCPVRDISKMVNQKLVEERNDDSRDGVDDRGDVWGYNSNTCGTLGGLERKI